MTVTAPVDTAAWRALADSCEVKCSCTFEAGDSPCEAHPTDEDGALMANAAPTRDDLAAALRAAADEVERLRAIRAARS